MQSSTSPDARRQPPAQDLDEKTGLPWFRTWRAVYLFVLGSFVLWVTLLYALSVLYS